MNLPAHFQIAQANNDEVDAVTDSAMSEPADSIAHEAVSEALPPASLEATSEPGLWQSVIAPLPAPLEQALQLGGPVTLVLALLSIVALAIVLFKSIQLYTARSRGKQKIETSLNLWQQARQQEALNTLADSRRGVANLVRIAMLGSHNPDVPEAVVREEVQRVASTDMESLRGHLRTLEVIGTVSPLLGLFGTVLGMIEAFRQMEMAGSQVDPSVLSGGIWQALLTTGVGLAVAIPAMLAHQWLDRRAERHALRIEDSVTRVFTAGIHKPMPARPRLPAAEQRHTHAT